MDTLSRSSSRKELLPSDAVSTTHEDIVRMTGDEILSQSIPWEVYQKANLVLERELDLLKRYDKKPEDVRSALLQKEGETYAELFIDLLMKISKEETLTYLLTLVDRLLAEHPTAITYFLQLSNKNKSFPYDPLIRILNRSALDWYTYAKASSILATLMRNAKEVPEESLNFFCTWLRDQLRKTEEKDICNAIIALQKVLMKEEFRVGFAQEDGLHLLATMLKNKMKNFQILYQIVYNLWLLSYNKTVAALMNDTKVIPYLVDILRVVPKEKVIRMSLATLRNLLNYSKNNELMIDCDIMRPLITLSHKNWGDEDIKEDIETLKDALDKNIVTLSSFDIYKKEVLSGHLEWSPVHRSEKFWRENAFRCEEDNNKVLVILKGLLTDPNTDPSVQAIACFDLGEFGRFHPRGKIILQQLSIKIQLMKLMEDRNPEVKKYALLAVQKMLVTNWEYLTH